LDSKLALLRPMADPGPAALHSLSELGLTRRQAEVLDWLLKGLSNKLIARELNLSVDTVKDHVAAVLRALGVTSRTQAVLRVSRMNQQMPGSDPTSR
jgi:DNA-binding NarL/FixJ family response regulator